MKETKGQAELLPPTQGEQLPAGNTPADLLRLAVAGGADVDKLEKLMALQERWQAGQAKREYVAAMMKFQSLLPTIPKIREVHKASGGLLYKFANLDDIMDSIRPIEKECGFMHRFDFAPREGGGCKCTCIVTHIGGHSESTTVSIPPTKGMNTNPAQDNGIEMTYGQRYAIIGAYGITTADEDRDANTATRDTITAEQAKTLKDMIAASATDTERFLGWLGVASLEAIPAARYEDAVRQLNKKLDAIAARGAK